MATKKNKKEHKSRFKNQKTAQKPIFYVCMLEPDFAVCSSCCMLNCVARLGFGYVLALRMPSQTVAQATSTKQLD